MDKELKKEQPSASQPAGQKSVAAQKPADTKKEVPANSVPGQAMSRDQRALEQELDQTKRAIVIQSPKGSFKIEKLHDNMFNVFQATFSQQMGIKKSADSQYKDQYTLTKDDVLKLVGQSVGKDFRVTVREHNMKNNTSIIKKDLLRRKIQEYFSKNPNSNSVIVSSKINGNKTIWKVDKSSSGFNVVEVNTQREQFMIQEAPATMGTTPTTPTQPTQGSQEFQQVMKLMTPIMGNLGTNQSQAVQARNQLNTLIGKIKSPQEKTQAGAFLNYLGALTGGQMASSAPNAPISTAPGSVPTPSTMTGLTSSKKTSGKKLQEDDKKDKEKDDKKKDKKPEKKPEPKEPKVKPQQELGPEEEPTSDPVDAGLETGAPPPEAPEGEDGGQPENTPKTGEEMQLKQLVQSKPVQDVDVFADEAGAHMVLSLGGLKNPVQLNFDKDGKITYKLGELSRVLKTGGGQ